MQSMHSLPSTLRSFSVFEYLTDTKSMKWTKDKYTRLFFFLEKHASKHRTVENDIKLKLCSVLNMAVEKPVLRTL